MKIFEDDMKIIELTDAIIRKAISNVEGIAQWYVRCGVSRVAALQARWNLLIWL